MGVIGTLFNSIAVVGAGLIGLVLLLAGSQQAAFGSEILGVFLGLAGIVLLVFASRL